MTVESVSSDVRAAEARAKFLATISTISVSSQLEANRALAEAHEFEQQQLASGAAALLVFFKYLDQKYGPRS